MKDERKIEILLKFVNSRITHNSNEAYAQYDEVDYAVEQEGTADGYEVYTFKHPNDEVCISENVYYYDSELPEVIIEALLDGGVVIYMDEYMYEELNIENELEMKFEEFVEDIIKEAIEGDIIITKKETEELKEEYYVEDEE